MNIGDLTIEINIDTTGFTKALDDVTRAFETFRQTLSAIELFPCKPQHRLTPTGQLAFNIARFVGFLPHEIMGWLETCPGAFQDEFKDGWQR